ncbi:hypothetical protein EMIHUDRAFT_43297, partial [Emiliania huxleyi CCMP1516]|uniref:Adenosine deaminase domain-containing protein n=2 Tax=Emiliania huxleyi TaxID=2903 RepID=A0A0D3JBF2_EMIH1
EFVAGLPKAELHLHIEGSLTPARAYAIAKRNGLDLDAFDPEKGAAARREFTSLVPFLIEYGKCSGVMRKEADFYDMMYDYLERAAENGVVHAEIFFDPQTHCYTDVSGFKTVITGLTKALEEGRKTLGVDGKLILCFLRDRSVEEALQVLEDARPYMEVKSPVYTPDLLGVGMDNAELGFRPGRFKPAYDKARHAREAGLHCVAHAGEEGDASYITEALDDLKIERVDHGVRCLEDPAVVERLVKAQTPLTVCPCSNHRLQVYPRFFCGENAVRQLLSRGVKVTVNSDDPAYF